MASIRIRTRRDGSTYFSVLFRADGAQRSVSFDDHAAALRFRRLLEQTGPDAALEIIGAETATADELTAGAWLAEYIELLTGIEPATRARYRAYLSNDIAPVFGTLPLSAVTETTIARWVHSLDGSAKTIANKHGFLSAALAGAVRAGHLTANPCDGRRLPRHHRPEMVFLTPAEFAILRDALAERWRPLATWLISTGTRFGEATALTVGDIDPVGRTARITKAWKYTGTGTRRLGPPKSRKGVRTIDLPDQALAAADLDGRASTELVFPVAGGGPVTAQLFHHKAWDPAVDRAEPIIGKRPRVHDLRHSCASWLIAAGIPLPVIQAHLGHENITTTIGTYGHLDRSSMSKAAGALGAALGGL